MGYYITLSDSTVVIPKAYEDEALRRLKAMNAPECDFAKSGGSWGPYNEGRREAWYRWMEADYDQKVTSVKDVFEALGFDTDVTDEGTTLVGYDNKTGQEDLFLFVLRDLIPDGAYIRFTGEDGALYEYSFRGGDMYERQGGWKVTPPAPLEAQAFQYAFALGETHLRLVPKGARNPETVTDFRIPEIFA